MDELNLRDLKITFNYIESTEELKKILDNFNIIVGFEKDTYVLRNETNENKFFVKVFKTEEDSLYYHYKISCHDEENGFYIDNGTYSIRKESNCVIGVDDVLKEAFYKTYRAISKKND